MCFISAVQFKIYREKEKILAVSPFSYLGILWVARTTILWYASHSHTQTPIENIPLSLSYTYAVNVYRILIEHFTQFFSSLYQFDRMIFSFTLSYWMLQFNAFYLQIRRHWAKNNNGAGWRMLFLTACSRYTNYNNNLRIHACMRACACVMHHGDWASRNKRSTA